MTMRAPKDGPEVKGDYYGLPWPCWGTPEVKHPGTPLLYNTNLARHGRRRHASAPASASSANGDAHCLLAEGSYPKDSEIKDGYPEFTYGVLKKLGWDRRPHPGRTCRHPEDRRCQSRHGVVVDRSVGRHPARRAQARLRALRQRQGAHERLGPARSDPGASRADLHAARRTGREISDAARRQAVPPAEHRLLGAEGRGRQGHRQAVPADPSTPAAWSNTRAAARRRAPTNGSPSCSRTCSSRSIRPTPPTAASRTAAGSG